MNKIISASSSEKKELSANQIKGIRIRAVGDNNIINICEETRFENCEFIMNSHCQISIGKSKYKIKNLRIFMNSYVNIEIGEDFSCLEADFRCQENNTGIKIGNDCMFSSEIRIYASDGHAIIDKKKPNIAINEGKIVKIGNHVWVGRRVTLLKNAEIGSGSIIGYGSIVTKKFSDGNQIISGYPAIVLRSGIDWHRKPPEEFNRAKR